MLPRRVMVLGGARSGKSAFAERLLDLYSKPKVYIATAQAHDEEMRARIAEHQKRRSTRWRLIEAPLNAAEALGQIAASEVALLDCATLWLSNQMLGNADPEAETRSLIGALQTCRGDVIVVSNEVGQGIVPEHAIARRFRDAQGLLNQRLAAQSELAVLVVAGLPLVLKGALPDGAA